ncbi:DDB1- and CUL4-associated factor 1 [Clonorchis sinensis]|uniref:DDB1- and CUL4-associated factor 1 n=1 Tax=Clonorchis sinensis TaxID=79923 RepID=A0A8T1MRN6_CLOSI|nr:DDB1- and CUL4-associated factor 1 [Clonorchis sinensis]
MMDEAIQTTRSAIERCEDLMAQWRAERNSSSFDPVPLLISLAELLEEQINIFFSTDPDPFDDRHPLRTDSSCDLGQILRLLSTHEAFLERITYVYLVGSNDPADRLVVAASRLLCAMRLGVTLSFTLDDEDTTINTLYRLALSDYEPTNCYALFLLGSVLDNTELLYITRQKNMQLIPVVVQRLAVFADQLKRELATATPSRQSLGMNNLLGSFHLHNLTTEMKVRLSIAYLLPIAEYQDLMPFMYNGGILDLIYTFISMEVAARDIRLTFEALRLLGNLMCHRCVYLEFVEKHGLEAVLKVPRPSVAATAVSVVLYYTAYFEDAMERVCQLPHSVLSDLIRYALWLVECSHPSARCYSLFFLNLVLCYGVTFDLFAAQNGLVYLFNAICVLPLRLTEDRPPTLKDTTSWHVVRASLCAIRRFLEISLLLWIDTLDPSLASLFDEPPRSVAATGCRPIIYTTEQMSRLISLVIARIRPDTLWPPTQQLNERGAVDVLYRIIARNVYAHNSWPCRNECTRLAVDILNLMSLTYDLADQIASTDVYSFPSGMNTASAAFLSSSPLFFPLTAIGDSPRSGAGSADVTVHLPSPNAPTGNSGSGNTGRNERRGLLNQLLEIVEQVGSGANGAWDIGHTGPNRPRRRIRDHDVSNENGPTGLRSGEGPANLGSDGQDTAIDGAESNNADEGTVDERVNGLHMLFSISREDDGWDVAVHKAVLAFVCTLVYRPIAEHEHPDNPIPATRVLVQFSSLHSAVGLGTSSPPGQFRGPSYLCSPSFKTPNRLTTNTVGRSARKRRLDEGITQPLFVPTDTVSPTPSSPLSQPRPQSPGGSSHSTNTFSESGMPSPMGRHKSTQLLYRQAHLWNIVRRQHGIMALLFHLETKQPISDADSVRTLACRGLVGLARSEEVRSMLAKMPLFTKALLQLLMKEPVLPDRLTQHAEFCRYATMLIRLVVGTLSDGLLSGDMSLERVRRAEIVAKTRIQWDQEELLELIYRHLQSKGLHRTATVLQQEANIKVVHPAPSQLPLYDDFNRPPGETPPYQPTPGCVASDLGGSGSNSQAFDTSLSAPEVVASASELTGPSGDSVADQPPPTPSLRLVKLRTPVPTIQTPKPYRDRFERPSIPNLYLKPVSNQPVPEMTLSKVVESFLLHQHAQCPHPVSVCPKFSLYHPHRCPDPRPNKQTNCCQRFSSRESLYGSLRLRPSRKEDRHFLHRRFQPTAVIREAEDDLLTACCFSLTDDGLFLGATSGAIAWVNVEEDGMPIELFHVQTSSIQRLSHTRDGERLLVCSEWGEPATVVARLRSSVGSGSSNNSPWEAVGEDFVFHVAEARHAEFSNTGTQDRLVATYGKMAKVFDLGTGARIADLFSAAKQSGYMLNKATFSPSDQLVLNDGVVWDLRCSGTISYQNTSAIHPGGFCRPVHKIDKLQDIVSGVFHPNGLEIIVGSAVWDVRTWRLLHTIQALDRLEVQFNATQDVIYAGTFGWDDEEYAELGNKRLVMQNMFRTVDALDYSLIASVDVRHRIEQLALDTTGQSLALVEKVGENSSNEPITQCRIYTVGRKRGEREPDNEEEEAREDEDDDDDEDNDEDDDELLNAETADELAQILDESSGSDGTSSSTESSDWSNSTVGSLDRVPHRRSRRLRARARRSEANDGARRSSASDQVSNSEVDDNQPMDQDDADNAQSDSVWETMDEEDASDSSVFTEDD